MRSWPSPGTKFSKKFTSHDLRRTVATRLAESLGDEGDKHVRRVLGHSDGSVTAIYNRYGYVREMRRALEHWANNLTSTHVPAQSPAILREVGWIGGDATNT
jgi:integrase